MNKKLISLAVAAAITAPAAALADVTFYGKAHVSIDRFHIKSETDDFYKGWTLNRGRIGKGDGRDSLLGIKGSEDLGADLKAIYQVEFGIPFAGERDYNITNGDRLKMRNTYVGLKGSFGTFLAGRHDTPLKISTSKLELFDDTMADYAGTLGFDDHRADSTVVYISPNFEGFQFAAATIPGSGSTVGSEEMDEMNRKSSSLAEGYSLAATYVQGPWYFGTAYEVLSNQLSFDQAMINMAIEDHDSGLIVDSELNDVKSEYGGTSDFKKWRVGLGIRDLSGFYLSAIYENQKSVDFVEKIGGKDNDADVLQGQLGYAFGNNMIKGMYGQRDRDASAAPDLKSWAIGFDHSFSKRTKAYVLYTDVDAKGSDEGDWKGLSLGMTHNF